MFRLFFLSVQDKSAAAVLVGLVSFGPSCGSRSGLPGVYTDVARYAGWMEERMLMSAVAMEEEE